MRLFDKVTSVDANEVELVFDDLSVNTKTELYITVDPDNSGTIQFSAGDDIDATKYAWPAGSKIPISIRNGVDNLRYKASAAGQVFTVTA